MSFKSGWFLCIIHSQDICSFAAAGAGLTGFKMARRTGGIEEFGFEGLGENHQRGVSDYCNGTLIYLFEFIPRAVV